MVGSLGRRPPLAAFILAYFGGAAEGAHSPKGSQKWRSSATSEIWSPMQESVAQAGAGGGSSSSSRLQREDGAFATSAITTSDAASRKRSPLLEQQRPPPPPPPRVEVNSASDLQLRGQVERRVCSMDLQPPNVGSRGHPDSCGKACKYIKRKGGCRYGAACPDCHLCFWTRSTIRDHHSLFALPLPIERSAEDGASLDAVDDDTASASSWLSFASSKICMLPGYQQYPWAKSKGTCEGGKNCGNACRYWRRKSGCMRGENCEQCHYCCWSRPARNREEPAESSTEDQRHAMKQRTKAYFCEKIQEGDGEEVEETGVPAADVNVRITTGIGKSHSELRAGRAPLGAPPGSSSTFSSSFLRQASGASASSSGVGGTGARTGPGGKSNYHGSSTTTTGILKRSNRPPNLEFEDAYSAASHGTSAGAGKNKQQPQQQEEEQRQQMEAALHLQQQQAIAWGSGGAPAPFAPGAFPSGFPMVMPAPMLPIQPEVGALARTPSRSPADGSSRVEKDKVTSTPREDVAELPVEMVQHAAVDCARARPASSSSSSSSCVAWNPEAPEFVPLSGTTGGSGVKDQAQEPKRTEAHQADGHAVSSVVLEQQVEVPRDQEEHEGVLPPPPTDSGSDSQADEVAFAKILKHLHGTSSTSSSPASASADEDTEAEAEVEAAGGNTTKPASSSISIPSASVVICGSAQSVAGGRDPPDDEARRTAVAQAMANRTKMLKQHRQTRSREELTKCASAAAQDEYREDGSASPSMMGNCRAGERLRIEGERESLFGQEFCLPESLGCTLFSQGDSAAREKVAGQQVDPNELHELRNKLQVICSDDPSSRPLVEDAATPSAAPPSVPAQTLDSISSASADEIPTPVAAVVGGQLYSWTALEQSMVTPYVSWAWQSAEAVSPSNASPPMPCWAAQSAEAPPANPTDSQHQLYSYRCPLMPTKIVCWVPATQQDDQGVVGRQVGCIVPVGGSVMPPAAGGYPTAPSSSSTGPGAGGSAQPQHQQPTTSSVSSPPAGHPRLLRSRVGLGDFLAAQGGPCGRSGGSDTVKSSGEVQVCP